MDHNISLITTVAAGFGVALILGFIAEWIKVPALVGYLVAGIIIGPATPGFVADINIASQLSEIGVMLLMFGVGLHFSLNDLLAVKRIAIPGAVVQMALATVLGMFMALWWGWDWGSGLIFGLSLSVASTVVLLKALEVRGVLDSMNGRIAVGWLVVEDLATVLVLVLLPPLAGVLGGCRCRRGRTSVGDRWPNAIGGRGLHRPDVHCWPPRTAVAVMARGAHRLARAVYLVRGRDSDRNRLRCGGAVQRVVRPRRIFRRHGDA